MPLEVIWTNDQGVSYSLNGNPTDDIMCQFIHSLWFNALITECLMFAGILYNCGELATSCSSCLGSNVAGFECGWCSSDPNQCTVIEECTADFSTTTNVCPRPEISSVQPNRGPVAGGTRVVISGTNLGAAFSDIAQVRLRSDAGTNVRCSLAGEMESYVPGLIIACETETVDFPGLYFLEVKVLRAGLPSEPATVNFEIEQPTLSGIEPPYGPKSGGVSVVISGTSLDTGNMEETAVTLNGVDCVVVM